MVEKNLCTSKHAHIEALVKRLLSTKIISLAPFSTLEKLTQETVHNLSCTPTLYRTNYALLNKRRNAAIVSNEI